MNRDAMPRLVAIAALFLLAACQVASGPAEEPPLAGAAIGGDFTLTDQHGQTREWKDFRGKYAIVYFGYTFCPDICPTDVQRTAQGLREFRKAHPDLGAKVQQIFISVDPTRDTPQVIGQFVSAFDPKIVGLTGTPEQLKAAGDAFKVYFSKGRDEGGGAYLVDHSAITYLFDPQGKPLATLPTDQGANAVAGELAKWVS
ncbi:SCO1/SenC family protein [Tsuneonella deserti]|uniref:SCO1/SenC family protein n=1 Tax=Tsuneonella deserti TaxID=2035528 RepID=A0ABQ1S0N7_9SPHN|nr:SCO family protein [Tsuneonella deserti]GGD87420.1 SCO1/SenC family protein [Tsuneonella deserti]